MKIGILTQPLHNNYGGLLQAYALQKFLKDQGHDVKTIDFVTTNKPRFFGIKQIILNCIKKYILKRPVANIIPINNIQKNIVEQHTKRFISEHISTTQRVSSLSEFSFIKPYHFDAFVVGSDQVWRPAYSPGMPAFFLNFVSTESHIRKIAYAASFGLDHCDEFTSNELISYSNLLQKFDAVGVREDSAVELCKKYFNTEAEHVLDPTMLLDADDYRTLVEYDQISTSDGNLMSYVLDKAPEKQAIIDFVAKEKGLKPLSVMPNSENDAYPPVTAWLRGFSDAEYVVTDSFHGVVFSIIFNRPFIAVGNKSRGLARFMSVLKLFGLEDRLVCSVAELSKEKVNKPIDFNKVNEMINHQKNIAKTFLLNALNKEGI